jgi:very-short-patch-repair endonuclease
MALKTRVRFPPLPPFFMRLYNINGRAQNKSVSKYRINWNEKSRSKLQKKVKDFLKPYWLAHIVYEEFPVYGTRLKVDILNATIKVAIEVQGPQHNAFHKFFHSNSRAKYLESIKRDFQKREWLEKNNFTLIELEGEDIKNLSKKFLKEKFKLLL